MNLSTKTRYGTRILIELALRAEQGPIQVSRISSQQKIPVKYLEQILLRLKKAGLVNSVRGPKGGHLLAKDPGQISLGQMVRLFEGKTELVECVSSPEKCELAADCLVRNAWQEGTAALYEKLDSISIADLIRSKGKDSLAGCVSL